MNLNKIKVLVSIFLIYFVIGSFEPPAFAGDVAASNSKTVQTGTLVWSDEFNASNGSRLDSSKWSYDVGGDGWGNNELEYYTNRSQNSFIQDGNLIMRAQEESYGGRKYTSARLVTNKKFTHKYGRIEASIKIPKGQGMWPAFWMLGSDYDTVSWPKCGEIDIMENVGKTPFSVEGSLHAPTGQGTKTADFDKEYISKTEFWRDYHVYAVEWDKDKVVYYVDNTAYYTVTKQQVLSKGGKWVFDQPFFILLNVAVGGDWPGSPDSTTVFPQDMHVDYVRVYDLTTTK